MLSVSFAPIASPFLSVALLERAVAHGQSLALRVHDLPRLAPRPVLDRRLRSGYRLTEPRDYAPVLDACRVVVDREHEAELVRAARRRRRAGCLPGAVQDRLEDPGHAVRRRRARGACAESGELRSSSWLRHAESVAKPDGKEALGHEEAGGAPADDGRPQEASVREDEQVS